MFYPELLNICNETNIVCKELIYEIDKWLAFLPLGVKDRITASFMNEQLGIDIVIARSVLEKCVEFKILKRKFGITCPICMHLIKIVDERDVVDEMSRLTECYACENEEFDNSECGLIVLYELIKEPSGSSEDKLKGLEEVINLKDDGIEKLKEHGYDLNNLFFNPTESDYRELEELYRGLSETHANTTEHGNSLENLVDKLFSLVKTFVSIPIRTKTNQIDRFIINKFPYKSKVLVELGNEFYCECKNEKKVPGNTYFHKMNSILVLSRNNNSERRAGIVISVQKPAKTADIIARETYLAQNILLLSLNGKELKRIIIGKENILKILEEKVMRIQHNITTKTLP